MMIFYLDENNFENFPKESQSQMISYPLTNVRKESFLHTECPTKRMFSLL